MAEPAIDPGQLRRRLLRGAVADNVATKEGRRPAPREVEGPAGGRIGSGRSRRRAVALAFLIAGGGFAAWWIVRPPPAVSPPAASVGADAALPEDAAAAVADVPAPEPKIFAAPTPIDADVFPLAVRRIVLDPGHGGADHGTAEGGLSEKDLTLDIALRLRDKLNEGGFEVVMTRDDDTTLSLRQRSEMANAAKADVFVSIHINWIEYRRIRGVETYYLGATDDPALNALARRENRESGYSLSDLRGLLDGIYADVRQDESGRLASRVQSSLYGALLRDNPGLHDRGVKTAPFLVLVTTEMPAILAEVSCLSNREDARLLTRPLYRDHIASALYRGIRGYASDVNQSEEKGS